MCEFHHQCNVVFTGRHTILLYMVFGLRIISTKVHFNGYNCQNLIKAHDINKYLIFTRIVKKKHCNELNKQEVYYKRPTAYFYDYPKVLRRIFVYRNPKIVLSTRYN